MSLYLCCKDTGEEGEENKKNYNNNCFYFIYILFFWSFFRFMLNKRNERLHTLREAGRVVCSKFGGDFVNCIEQGNQSAQKLLEIVRDNFPSFRDTAYLEGHQSKSYQDHVEFLFFLLFFIFFLKKKKKKKKKRLIRVQFYKRMQILVADLWACFSGEGYGKFHDIDTLTAFADYRSLFFYFSPTFTLSLDLLYLSFSFSLYIIM